MRRYRVTIRLAGARAWYVSDEHAETPQAAVCACITRRTGEWRVGLRYEVVVQEVEEAA